MPSSLSITNNNPSSDLPQLSQEQIDFIQALNLPIKVSQMTSSQFDITDESTAKDIWRFVIGAERQTFNFGKIVDINLRKLAKLCCVWLIVSGRVLRHNQFILLIEAFQIRNFSFSGIKEKLKLCLHSPDLYFEIKAILRLLCQHDMPGFGCASLDKFLSLPLPNVSNQFLKYQDLENAFPSALKGLITKSLLSASNRRHSLSKRELVSFTNLGICYFVGLRPVQYAALTAGHFKLDTHDKSSGLYRYCVDLPYAKQSKITSDTIRIALPQELGLLIQEYIERNSLNTNDRFYLSDDYVTNFLNECIQDALLLSYPSGIQEEVLKGNFVLPRLTTTCFRHNVGHSLALSGASAEEIAHILGHSSTIAASYYISATPELAMLKSKVLGDNPVWQNMVTLMLTGDLVASDEWDGYTVTGSLGGQLHVKIGGCSRPSSDCPLSKVRSCYGCFYFRPFKNVSKHNAVSESIDKEIIDTLVISEQSGCSKNPALAILQNLKGEVQMVINRLNMGEQK